jgi:hypothetical protein
MKASVRAELKQVVVERAQQWRRRYAMQQAELKKTKGAGEFHGNEDGVGFDEEAGGKPGCGGGCFTCGRGLMDDPIEIEQGVPISGMPRGIRRQSKYPFMKMAVGDSFFVASEPGRMLITQAAICTAMRRGPSLHPHLKFTTRRVEGGVRCWRVE